jgi:hypothetical protein
LDTLNTFMWYIDNKYDSEIYVLKIVHF